MSAHALPQTEYEALSIGAFNGLDPGDDGLIVVANRSLTIVSVTTVASGTSTMTVTDPAVLAVGTRLQVFLRLDGGDLTVDTDDTDVVFTAVGDCAEWVVSPISATDNEWKIAWSNVT